MCLANAAAAAAPQPPTSLAQRTTRLPALFLKLTTVKTEKTVVNSQEMLDLPVATIKNVSMAAYNVSKRLPKRHSKRHSNWFDYNNFNENSTDLEWINPCGGYYMPTTSPLGESKSKKHLPNKIYNILKRSANNELSTLRGNQQDINITNIKIWLLHDYTYKFLPKLKINSTIALKRWYRNMQTYVASFAYLRRVQLKWDHAKSQRESSVARELKRLLISSRVMLCELETAVNSTRYQKNKKFEQLTRAQLEKRLKLRSKRRFDENPNDMQEADRIDLKFVKYYYYEFLDTMFKVLRRVTKRKGKGKFKATKRNNFQIDFNEVDKFSQNTTTRSHIGKGGRLRRKKTRASNK